MKPYQPLEVYDPVHALLFSETAWRTLTDVEEDGALLLFQPIFEFKPGPMQPQNRKT